MSVDIEAIRWLLDNATAYAISKNCGMSIQAVDKYKNGVSDIMNMRLKHAISMITYAQELKKQWFRSLFLFLTKYPPILHVNVFLKNRIVILLFNRSKCLFLQNRNTNSNFVNINKIGNQALYKAICWCQQVNFFQTNHLFCYRH